VVKSPLYGAEVCWTLDQAQRAFHKLAAKWGFPILVQRFVKAEEFCVCCVGDGAGGLDGAVPMKKLVITDQGKGWAGVTVSGDGLLDLARRTIGALGWRGPCELEVLREASGQLHIIEINPRFPAWCDLTAGAGQNQPLQVVRRALGESPPPLPPYRVGTAFVRISLDQIVPIEALAGMAALGEQLQEVSA
jgi:carbamoyl-phosphate synthase large subunit